MESDFYWSVAQTKEAYSKNILPSAFKTRSRKTTLFERCISASPLLPHQFVECSNIRMTNIGFDSTNLKGCMTRQIEYSTPNIRTFGIRPSQTVVHWPSYQQRLILDDACKSSCNTSKVNFLLHLSIDLGFQIRILFIYRKLTLAR